MAASPEDVGIGIDVGGTKVLAVATTRSGEVLAECRSFTPRRPDELMDELARLADALVSEVTRLGAHVAGIGIGVPGPVDRSGCLRFAPNLLGASGLDVRGGLTRRLGDAFPVVVDNDATCAAAGEQAFGAAKGASDCLLVTVGTGIGGGIVSGGQVVRGAHNFAGEIGHMVVDPHGPPCPCGKRGCWERYASGSGLGRLARDAAQAGSAAGLVEAVGGDPDLVRGEHVVEAAIAGDLQAQVILDEFAWWLGLGLANLVNVLDPSVVVLAGGMAVVGERLLAPARAALADFVELGGDRPHLELVAASLGERSGAIGASVNGLGAGSPPRSRS